MVLNQANFSGSTCDRDPSPRQAGSGTLPNPGRAGGSTAVGSSASTLAPEFVFMGRGLPFCVPIRTQKSEIQLDSFGERIRVS